MAGGYKGSSEASYRTLKNVGRCTVAFLIFSAIAYTAVHISKIKVIIGALLYWSQGLGGWGLLALFAAYIVAIVLMIPTTLLNLGMGYSFGVWLGFPCMLLGGVVGASVAFQLGRTLARDCVISSFYHYSSYVRRVDQGLLQGRGAFRFVFLSRVPPCMPFPVLNYLYGTTGVDFYTYVIATAAGLCPGTFMYVYTGHALRSLVDLLSGDPQALSLQYQVLFVAGIVMTILVSMYLANEARLVGQLPLPSEAKPSVTHEALSLEVTPLGTSGSQSTMGGLSATRLGDSLKWAQNHANEEMGLLECDEHLRVEPGSIHGEATPGPVRADEGFMVWLSTFDVRALSTGAYEMSRIWYSGSESPRTDTL